MSLILITIAPFTANFLETKLNLYFLIFCFLFLYCFIKSSLLLQFSLIASLMIVIIIHFVFYLTAIVNPKIFFGFQAAIEILIIQIVLRFCLKKPLAIFSASSTGIVFSEILIRIFNYKIYGITIEQIDSGFNLIAGITLLAFIQFVLSTKGRRSIRRLLL